MSGIPSVVTMSGDLPELVRHRDTGLGLCRGHVRGALPRLEYFLTRPTISTGPVARPLASRRSYSERVRAGGAPLRSVPKRTD